GCVQDSRGRPDVVAEQVDRAREGEQKGYDERNYEPRCGRELTSGQPLSPPQRNDEPEDRQREGQQSEIAADLGGVRTVHVPRPERLQRATEEEARRRWNDDVDREQAEEREIR